MRFLLLLIAVILLGFAPVRATTYDINLLDVGTTGYSFFGSCHCGSGSIFNPLPATPGDVFDFGIVGFNSDVDGHALLAAGPNGYVYVNLGHALANFGTPWSDNQITPFDSVNFIAVLASPFPQFFHTEQLLFTVPDGASSIQVAFTLTGNYIPPSVSAVPEPSTWAMLLIGLAATALLRKRRHLLPKPT